MKREYLGETKINWKEHPQFKDFTRKDWAILYIERYGGIDGSHHKDWVLDQVSRILLGSPIKVKVAEWTTGEKDFRYKVGKSQKYKDWVLSMKDAGGYETGIAP